VSSGFGVLAAKGSITIVAKLTVTLENGELYAVIDALLYAEHNSRSPASKWRYRTVREWLEYRSHHSRGAWLKSPMSFRQFASAILAIQAAAENATPPVT